MNIIKIWKILEYENLNPNFENVKGPVFKAILKLTKIKNLKFTFHEVDNEKIIKEIKGLNKNKASQRSDIPIIIIHENADISADFLAESLKGAIKSYNFANCLKVADITPLHTKEKKRTREIIDQLVLY